MAGIIDAIRGLLTTKETLQSDVAATNRQQVQIAIIDDEDFTYLDILQRHNFILKHFRDIEDVRAVHTYPIVLCDTAPGVLQVLSIDPASFKVVQKLSLIDLCGFRSAFSVVGADKFAGSLFSACPASGQPAGPSGFDAPSGAGPSTASADTRALRLRVAVFSESSNLTLARRSYLPNQGRLSASCYRTQSLAITDSTLIKGASLSICHDMGVPECGSPVLSARAFPAQPKPLGAPFWPGRGGTWLVTGDWLAGYGRDRVALRNGVARYPARNEIR